MDKVTNQSSLTDEEINNYKCEFKKLKIYKFLNSTINVAFVASLVGFFYTHFTARDKDYIAGAIFAAILLSKLYLDNKIDNQEKECEKADIKIRSLKKM